MEHIYILLSSFIIMMASFGGVFFASKKFTNFYHKNNSRLIGFSTGVFLMMVLSILGETFEHSDNNYLIFGLIIAGYITARLLNIFLPEFHDHHDKNCDHEHQKIDKGLISKIIGGDFLHNIVDGIIIVPAFMLSPFVGLVTAFSIFVHELLQEISEFFILRQAGLEAKKALIYNFLGSLSMLVGVGIGYFATSNEFLEIFLLAFSSGMFINVIVKDLLPGIYKKQTFKQIFINLIAVIIGIGLLFVVSSLAPHEHHHDESGDGHHHYHHQEHDNEHEHNEHDEHNHDEHEHADHDDHDHENGEHDHDEK